MRNIWIAFVCILGFNFSWAQNGNSYKSEFIAGNKSMDSSDYTEALDHFIKAQSFDSSSACLSYKIGLCMYNMYDKKIQAIKYFEKAAIRISKQCDLSSSDEKNAPPIAYYYLGILYQKTYHFSEAVNAFKSYQSLLTDNDHSIDTKHLVAQCNSAKMYIMAPSNAKVIDLDDSINTIYSDYNAIVQQDQSSLIFTSQRPNKKNTSAMPNGEYHPYIYISNVVNDSVLSLPKPEDVNLNFLISNTCVSITPDGQEMILYSSNEKEGALYISHMGDTHWEKPDKLGADINKVGTQSTACLSPDGNTLYFVSDRMGGMGGKDIWRSVKLPNGNWSLAVNLGKSVNTPYDEETPFMHADGRTFFFSSQGHNSMGGYDIFFSQVLDSGKFSEPFNLGYPINTPDDETHFSLSVDGKKGYFNSDREGGKGRMDIYKVIMPHATERPLTVIKGQVLPSDDESISDDVHIIATDSATHEQVGDFKPIKATGKFTIIVPPGRTYTLSYQDDDNEFYKQVIHVPADAGYKEIHKALSLSPHSIKGGDNTNSSSENLPPK